MKIKGIFNQTYSRAYMKIKEAYFVLGTTRGFTAEKRGW